MLNKLAISNRHSLLVKIANVIRYLGEIRELAPFADDALKALKNIAGGRAGFVGSAPEALEQLAKGSDELASVVSKNPEEFLQTFKGLGAEQKFAINQLWSRLPQSNGGSVAIEEFAASAIRSADKLKANLSSIDKFIARNPSEFLTKYNNESTFKSAIDKIWKSHPESKNFSSIEDFAKSKIKPTTAPAVSTAPATSVTEVAPEVAGGTRTVTPAGEVVSDAGGAISRADEAAAAGTKVARTSEEILEMVKKANSVDEVAVIVSSNKAQITDDIAKRMLDIYESNPDKYLVDYNKLDDSIKTIMADLPKTKGAETTLNKIADLIKAKVEVELSLARAAVSGTKPISGAAAVGESVDTAAAVAAKSTNARRIGKYVAGAALGLTGIALINYMMSDDKEEGGGLSQSGGTPPITGGSSSPQAGIGEYERASAIMIDKGYLSAPQSTWTPDFDKAFREFIDAGTANNKALTRTNLVGGQTWPAVASGLGFPGDKNGALSAVSVLSRFVPSKRAPSAPTVTTPTTGESGVAQPERGAGGRGTESSKVDVLADIISRLYNDRLVEGGGGIFSNDLRQTQRVVKALPNGASLEGYRQVAELLLSRNPALGDKLPKTRITDVLSKKNIKSNPAYEAVLETQQTIHKLYEDANPGIINPLRGERAIKNIQKYLGSSAGGNWQLEAKNRSENMSKRGISKRATEMEGYGLRKEALAPLAIAAIGIGLLAVGIYGINYISGYRKIAAAYPDLGKRTELDILARFKKDLDNLWFNSHEQGVLAYDAYAYFLGFNYGYDENKLVEKLKEIGVDFGDESFEEMMNDDEDGSYYSVVHHLNKGREDRAKADKGVAAQGGPEAVVEGTKSDSSSPQGTMEYTQLVGAPGTIKIEEVNDGQKFIYTIKSPTEFSYVWLYSDGSKRKSRDSVTTENFSSKWNQAAETINKLPVANDAMAKSGFSRDRFVKLAEARKAKIREEVLVSLTPAEKAVIRRNKMREI